MTPLLAGPRQRRAHDGEHRDEQRHDGDVAQGEERQRLGVLEPERDEREAGRPEEDEGRGCGPAGVAGGRRPAGRPPGGPLHTARRPASARPSVTSSAYSRSPPTGRPEASRVTTTSGARARRPSAMCSAVASPVVVELVASTTSLTPPLCTRA